MDNNWISPLWWGSPALDRTIGIQYLIALSQKLFGNYTFAIHLPITISGIIMLLLTYKLHKELLNNKFQIISPIILSTTFLWINYVHLATQDIIFATIITFGILFTIYAKKFKKNIFFFFSGLWIGLAFMMKTFLVFVPLLAIFPFLYKYKIFRNNNFWLGLLIGFLPFIYWSLNIIFIYGQDVYLGLFRKLLFLTKNNNFTNPIYYYLWNLPLNLFPWSIFAIIGFFNARKINNEISRYFLYIYPLIILIIISTFSTKTPYYPLQTLSLLSINSFLGMDILINSKKKFYSLIRLLTLNFLPIIILIFVIYININYLDLSITSLQKSLISIGLIIFSLSWLYTNNMKSNLKKISIILIGPYLMTFLIVQSGLLSDRSRDLRIETEKIVKKENLQDKKIQVLSNELGNQDSVSKIIKISLMMPKIGNGLKSKDNLEKNQYFWTTNPNIDTNKFTLISDKNIFKPWKLIKKN